MAKRADILARLPVVFGLSETEAAASVGICATTFRKLIEKRLMPRPRRIEGRLVYDVDEVRAAFKAMPHDGEVAAVNPWDSVHERAAR